MKKRCELCKSRARIYCDSDRSSLCWTSDSKVHSANFLIARHSRILLCQLCQSFTPWSASGEKLCPSTASICRTCVVEGVSNDDDELSTNVDVENDTDQGLSRSSLFPSPLVASSSGSEEILTRDRGMLVKRKRRPNVPDLTSENELDCSSGIKTALFNSMSSSSEATIGSIKRIPNRNRLFNDHMTAEVHGNCKWARMFELDLNASP